jgi:leucyl-tRNA synthetase
MLGKTNTIAFEKWPEFKEEFIKDNEIEILVQLKGKPLTRIAVSASLSKEDLEKEALSNPDVKEAIAGKTLIKVIAVPGRLVNLVVK